MVVAIPYGLIALRTRRHQFVILTVALFFVFQLVAVEPLLAGRLLRD